MTKQKDHSIYSDRWGCAATCLINIAELTRGDMCTDREVDSIVGNWDRTGHVTVCNYEQVDANWNGIRNSHISPPQRWSSDNDQQSHFKIMDWRLALRDVFWSLDISWLEYIPSQFNIIEYSGASIPSHFCLEYVGEVINPDPNIDISKMTETRRFRI